jgi:hypothetical protein
MYTVASSDVKKSEVTTERHASGACSVTSLL